MNSDQPDQLKQLDRPDYPQSAAQWREFLEPQNQVTERSILEPVPSSIWTLAGLVGDKASLQSLLDLLIEDPGLYGRCGFLNNIGWWYTFAAGTAPDKGLANLATTQVHNEKLCIQGADLQMAVALALSWDGNPGTADKLRSRDDGFLEWKRFCTPLGLSTVLSSPRVVSVSLSSSASVALSASLPSSTWGEQDRSLLKSALKLWCPTLPETNEINESERLVPANPLTSKTAEEVHSARQKLTDRQTARLILLTSIFTRQTEVVDAFVDHGVDMSRLSRWVAIDATSMPELNHAWVNEIGEHLPLVLLIAGHGAMGCAARLMAATNSPEMLNITKQTARFLCENDMQKKYAATKLIFRVQQMSHLRSEQSFLEGVIQFADQLLRHSPSLQTQTAQIMFVGNLIGQKGGDADLHGALFIRNFFDLTGHKGRPPMSELLANWTTHAPSSNANVDMRLDHNSHTQSNFMRSSCRSAMTLLMTGLLNHQDAQGVSKLDPRLFTEEDRAFHSLRRREIISHCFQPPNSKLKLEPEKFKSTLLAVHHQGIDVFKRIKTIWSDSGDTLLHQLAVSKCHEKMAHLVAALDLGCNPMIKNSSGCVPGEVTGDMAGGMPGGMTKEEKAQWDGIVQSHQSKTQALAALEEIKKESEFAALKP